MSQRKADFATQVQALERRIEHAIFVEVDFLSALPRRKKAIAIAREEPSDAARALTVLLGPQLAALPLRIVLQLTCDGIKDIANDALKIFVGIINGWVARSADRTLRYLDIDVHGEMIASRMVLVRHVDRDVTATDSMAEPLEPGRALPYDSLDGV